MDLNGVDIAKATWVAAWSFLLTDVLKNYIPIKDKAVQATAFVFALILSVGEVYLRAAVPEGKDLIRAIVLAVATALVAIWLAKARSAGPQNQTPPASPADNAAPPH